MPTQMRPGCAAPAEVPGIRPIIITAIAVRGDGTATRVRISAWESGDQDSDATAASGNPRVRIPLREKQTTAKNRTLETEGCGTPQSPCLCADTLATVARVPHPACPEPRRAF